MGGSDGVRLAVGEPGYGIEGFRATHEQALTAQSVSAVAGDGAATLTTYREAGLVSFLVADLDGARRWVAQVLGPLAGDDDQARRLRETLRVFLETGGGYTDTAARLHMHKNGVLGYSRPRSCEGEPSTTTGSGSRSP